MARFLTGPTIGGISQSTGGATFAQAGPTGILRTNRARARVRDFYSLQNRAYFFRLLYLWQNALTDNERLAWLALGGSRAVIDVFGNPVPLNGLGTFLRYNLPLLAAGIAFNVIPPVDFTATLLSTFTITASSTAQTVKLTALFPNITASEQLVIACSTTRSPGYTSLKPRVRIMARVPGPVTLPVDFSPRWIQFGGVLYPGTVLLSKIKVLKETSGFYGPVLSAIFSVT